MTSDTAPGARAPGAVVLSIADGTRHQALGSRHQEWVKEKRLHQLPLSGSGNQMAVIDDMIGYSTRHR